MYSNTNYSQLVSIIYFGIFRDVHLVILLEDGANLQSMKVAGLSMVMCLVLLVKKQ